MYPNYPLALMLNLLLQKYKHILICNGLFVKQCKYYRDLVQLVHFIPFFLDFAITFICAVNSLYLQKSNICLACEFTENAKSFKIFVEFRLFSLFSFFLLYPVKEPLPHKHALIHVGLKQRGIKPNLSGAFSFYLQQRWKFVNFLHKTYTSSRFLRSFTDFFFGSLWGPYHRPRSKMVLAQIYMLFSVNRIHRFCKRAQKNTFVAL